MGDSKKISPPPGATVDIVKERRKHYIGIVEVWANGAKRLETSARLVGYSSVSVIQTLGNEDEPFEGQTSWDGHIEISETDAQAMIAERLELRLPDGRAGEARLDGTGGRVEGFGVVPFD